MYYVYILKWKQKHYIWYTNNIERRLGEHKRWRTITTKLLWVHTLIGYFEKETEEEAQKFEKIIKNDGHINHRIDHITFKRIDKKFK